MSGTVPRLLTTDSLTTDQVAALAALVVESTHVDGVPPLREEVLLRVRTGRDGLSILALGPEPDSVDLLGFAHLDADEADGPALEIAVHPRARNQGIGTALLDTLLTRCPPAPSPVRLWAHGQNAAAAQLARARGFLRERHLYQMRRSLFSPLPPVELPAGVTIRPFDPQRDVTDLQALNAAAFTRLPDQGGWTEADIRARMAEEWFDPPGLLLATDGAQLLGFHWTKVAPAAPDSGLAVPQPLGEVYVVGVHPDARGRGLGRALTLAGLHHLRDRGLTGALLYVDATNVPAVELYTSLGFSVWDSDMLFRR